MPQHRIEPRLLLAGMLSQIGQQGRGQQQGLGGDFFNLIVRSLLAEQANKRILDRQTQMLLAREGVPGPTLEEGSRQIAERNQAAAEALARSRLQEQFQSADLAEKAALVGRNLQLRPQFEDYLRAEGIREEQERGRRLFEAERGRKQEFRGRMRRGEGTPEEQRAFAGRALRRFGPQSEQFQRRLATAQDVGGETISFPQLGGPPVTTPVETPQEPLGQSETERLASLIRMVEDPSTPPGVRDSAGRRVSAMRKAINVREGSRAAADAAASAGPAAVQAILQTSQDILVRQPAMDLIEGQTFSLQVNGIKRAIDQARVGISDADIGTLMGNLVTLVASTIQSGVLTEGDIQRTSGQDTRSFLETLNGLRLRIIRGEPLEEDEIDAMVLLADEALKAKGEAFSIFAKSQLDTLLVLPGMKQETIDAAVERILQNVLSTPAQEETLLQGPITLTPERQ